MAAAAAAAETGAALSHVKTSDREWTIAVILADTSRGRPMGTAAAELIVSFRELIDRLAEEAELPDIESFGMSWRILSNGAILKAVDGDLDSASRAREMTVDLIVRHRQPQGSLPDGEPVRDLARGDLSRGGLAIGVAGPVALAQTAASAPFTDADYRVWEFG